MKIKLLSFTTILLTAVLIAISFAQDNTQAGLPEGAIARLGKGGINIMRFSPDGTHLAVGTDVGVWLYDVPDGSETALFTGHTGHVNALAFSQDGKILASGGFSNPIIQLWDVEAGTKLSNFTLSRPTDSIDALTFSEDAKTLISLDMVGRFTHWNIETGSKTSSSSRMQSHEAVVFSPANNILASGHSDGKIRLWDATTGKRQATLTGHARLLKREDKEVWALAFSPDGKMLASGSQDKTVKLWNADNRKNLATFQGHNGWVIAVAFSADGSILASGGTDKVIKLWNVNTKQERVTLIGHTNAISALAFSPDGKTLASGSYDGTIRFWNQDTGEEISTFTAGHTEWVKTVAFSENGTILTSASFDGSVDVWSLKTKRELTTFTAAQNENTNGIAFSPDATLLVSQGTNGATLAFSPHGFGYSGSGAGIRKEIKLWDITTGDHIPGPWQDLDRTVNALAISPDNKILVAGIRHRDDILAWNINTGEEMFHVHLHSPFSRRLEFSPNGKLFASGAHNQTQIWDVGTQQRITPSNMDLAETVAFSPDSTLLASGHHDHIVLWDIKPTGMKQRGKILDTGHNKELKFSPDGNFLVTPKTNGWKNLIQLWGVKNGWNLGTLSGHTEEITVLEFSTDGKTFASGSKDGTVLLWDWEKIVTKAMNDAIEKNLSSNLAPPDKPVEYASKVEEAEAILNWMQKNGYKVKKTLKGYTLTRDGGGARIRISGGGGGRISSGKVNVKIDGNGVLEIHVVGVGLGTFVFDDEGKLKHKSLDEGGKKTDK